MLAVMVIAAAAVSSCSKLLPPEPASEEVLAGTVPGLTPEQERDHLVGDAFFGRIFATADGLGPVFVQNSCASCHNANGKGHPSTMVTRFGNKQGSVIDHLTDKGGFQLQPRSVAGYVPEYLPAEANVITRRLAPAVMGLGYIAALHDQDILANADSADSNSDGISGRPGYVTPTSYFSPLAIHMANNGKYIGRFGKKAEKVTITDQVVFALKQDIGITSDLEPEDIYNPLSGNFTGDELPDPEVSMAVVNGLVFYMRTLKAPERRNANDPDVLEGEKLFAQSGCANCHKPTFTTAKSDIEALSQKEFHPYSDFLLHDMGPMLDDGYPEGGAESSEWRTPPLWGLGLAATTQGGKMFLLHDGRAQSIEQVLSFHGGEASGARTAFFNLSATQREQVVKFLMSL